MTQVGGNLTRESLSLKNVRAPADGLESGVSVITDPLTHSHGHRCCPRWERSLLVEIQAEGWDLTRDWTHADGRHARAEKPFRLSQGKISPDAKEQNDLRHCLLAIRKQTHFCFTQEAGEYNWINMKSVVFWGSRIWPSLYCRCRFFLNPAKSFWNLNLTNTSREECRCFCLSIKYYLHWPNVYFLIHLFFRS